MKYLSAARRVQILCNEDRIPGAIHVGFVWAIPDDAEKPADVRIKSGRYIKKTSEDEK